MIGTKPMKMWAVMALSAGMILSGCHSTPPAGTKNADGSITNADGSVTYPAGTKPGVVTKNADGSITNPDGSTTYPAGTAPAQAAKEEAPAPAAAESTPAPAPESAPVAPPPAPVAIVVPSGTSVHVSISQTLSAKKSNVGDSFSGVLSESLHAKGGATAFKRGTEVSGTVVAAKGQGRFKGEGTLGIELNSIGGMRVHSSAYEQVAKGKGKRTAVMAGGGTGAGALIGGLAGGGKGALIGGLVGAGAGTAGAAFTGNKDVSIPAESIITFKLTSALTLK